MLNAPITIHHPSLLIQYCILLIVCLFHIIHQPFRLENIHQLVGQRIKGIGLTSNGNRAFSHVNLHGISFFCNYPLLQEPPVSVIPG